MSESTVHILAFIQTLLLTTALPLSCIAAYGARGTRWGSVLRPIPVVEVSFIVGISMGILHYDTGVLLLVQALVFAVGVLATTVISFRLARLARGGVKA